MRVLGVVCARAGSQRLPGKNVAPLGGRPVIEYTLDAALEASALTSLVVSTDDDRVATIARRRHVRLVRRPPELTQDTAPIDDALRHAVDTLEAEGATFDAVACLQANVPLRDPRAIDRAIARLAQLEEATAVATALRVRQRPEWMKVIVDPSTLAVRPFLRRKAPFRVQDLPPLCFLDGAVVVVRTHVLCEARGSTAAHAYLGPRIHVVLQDEPFGIEIDDAGDLEEAERRLAAMRRRGRPRRPPR